jgi:hypothetical protein
MFDSNVRNVVPFRSTAFAAVGIDWTREAVTESERALRGTYLTYETSCGPDGLASVVLLSIVARRQGRVASDLQAAAEFAEIILAAKLRKHQDEALEFSQSHLAQHGPLWS